MSKVLSEATTAEETSLSQGSHINGGLVWILSIACGFTAANVYYIQPILAEIGHEFTASVSQVGLLVTFTQIGYAAGLLLIVPLGDRHSRRTLIVTMLILVTLALVAMAIAPTLPFLMVASLAIGFTTVIPQLIIPFAASLAHEKKRGHVVGSVMSGLLLGIMLSRTVSGFVNVQLGWRAMYWIAAGFMVLLAIVLRLMLPSDHPQSDMSYGRLLHSLWGLGRTEPALREASLFGALAFAAFSSFWATLSFYLATPPYHYGSSVAGLFGLVGILGVLLGMPSGFLGDKIGARKTTGISLGILIVSFVIAWATGQFLWGLGVGVVLLVLGTQVNQVSNQAVIYGLHPATRNRYNSIYMFTYYIGGALGSLLGTYGWSRAGWMGVCSTSLLLLLLALVVYAINSWRKGAVSSRIRGKNGLG